MHRCQYIISVPWYVAMCVVMCIVCVNIECVCSDVCYVCSAVCVAMYVMIHPAMAGMCMVAVY